MDIDNHLSLSVNPRRVDSCEEETNVKISITGTGLSEMETIRYSDGTTVDYEPHTVEFYVQQSDVEADLDLLTSQNTGVNTDGDERRGTKDSTEAMAQITLGAASFLPVIGPAAGVGSLGLTLMDAMEDNNNAMKEYTMDTDEPYGEIGATYYIEEDDDDLYDNDVIYFGFSTEVQWTIPSEHRDDIHELEIGASIENEEASSYGSGTAYDYEYGAETDPITVELKNAEPTLEEEELQSDKDTYYTSDTSINDYIFPELSGLEISNPAGCTEATYQVELEYWTEWEDEWKPVESDIYHGEDWTESVGIKVPDHVSYEEVKFRYTVIYAEEKYGGWEIQDVWEGEVEVLANNDEDDDGPTPVSYDYG